MKNSIILVISLVCIFSISTGAAQETPLHKKVTLNYINMSVPDVLKDLGKKAGIKTRPHGLRHSAITEALEATGGNIRAVARFSRHKNIQTLMIYDDNRQDLGGEIAKLIASGV